MSIFITADGKYTPTCVLNGRTNAVMYLQSSLLSDKLRLNSLWWLNDILIYPESVAVLFCAISLFFSFRATYNFKLHPGKYVMFATTIHWWGRLISSDGISFSPAESKQFFICLNWRQTSTCNSMCNSMDASCNPAILDANAPHGRPTRKGLGSPGKAYSLSSRPCLAS